MRHLDETGVYVHVIADGGIAAGGDVAKAIVCSADAVMTAHRWRRRAGARTRLPLGDGGVPSEPNRGYASNVCGEPWRRSSSDRLTRTTDG